MAAELARRDAKDEAEETDDSFSELRDEDDEPSVMSEAIRPNQTQSHSFSGLQPSKAPRQPEQPLQPQQPVAPQPPAATAPLPPQQPTSFVWVPPTPPRQLLPVPVLAREGGDHHHPPLLAGRPLTLPQSLPVSQPQHEQVPQQLLAPQQASQPRSTQQYLWRAEVLARGHM